MTIATLVAAVERLPLPDTLTRAGISALVARSNQKLGRADPRSEARFVAEMASRPVAVHTDEANAQHYEVPAAFFAEVLGPRRKYSCCLYRSAGTGLADAEEEALRETCLHAGLQDGQDILELGCGWGSLSLWMAEHYPQASITSVSNSHSQRLYIEGEAEKRGLSNLTVVTQDMNSFAATLSYDRIVSVEMFEHMSNWQMLLGRVRSWLRPDGRLFLHVFSHMRAPYWFDRDDKADWIAQHFFTGGIMPSHGLVRQFGDLFTVEEEWRWNGEHYARTARDWLDRFDRRIAVVRPVLATVYGEDARLWERRWRLFFLATEGLFGHAGGEPWGISHYRLKPAD